MTSKRQVRPQRLSSAQTRGGTTARMMRWRRVNRRLGAAVTVLILAVAQPAQQLGQGGSLAVHQDADAVEARGEPKRGPYAEDHKGDGNRELPERRRLRGHAQEHDNGRRGREERGRDGPERVRIV